MIPSIPIQKFKFYSNNPEKGLSKHTDSTVIEQEITFNETIYDIKLRIEIDYTRWYQPSTTFEPKEDCIEVLRQDIELLKITPDISEKLFRKIEKMLIETISIE